ncbi:MAG: hypothetical protein KVP17_002775 [Porospora cf. gigantea B]|nr:MAG: hypothetical protein KVP17_002775 [Porospora cf. gigantea B]
MERVMKQNHHSRRKRRGPRGGHLDTTRTRDPSCLLSQPLAGSPTTTLVGRTLYTSSGFRRKLKLDSFPLETSVDSLLQRVFVSSPVSCGCLMCLFLRDCCERLRENVAGVDRLTPSLCLTCPATAMGRHIAAAEVSVTGRPHSKHPCPFDFSPEESGQVVSSLVFQELTVPRSQMCEFLLLAADAIAPAGLRSLLSRRKWRRYICDIVLLHKGEVITMHSLLQGIAIGPLLSSFDVEPTQALQARLCLLLARMFAFVGSSVCSLVKASFVAMDSETEGHRLLFFRKIVAQRLIKHLTNSLTINHEPVAACKYQPLLRWTAKRTGARPLVDCAARNSGRLFAGLAEGDILEGAATIAQRRMSINAATAPILRRLTAWMECYPHGISVMGFNHVLLRLRAYIQALDLSNRRPLRFYVAVADLSGCFNELRISDLNTRLKQHLSRSTLDTALRSSLFFCTLFRDRGGPNAFRIAKLAMRSFHGLDCHVPSVLDDSLNWLDTRQRNQLREAPKVKLLSVVVPSTLLYLGNLTSDVTSFLRLLDERYSFRVDGLAFRPTLGIPQGLAASPRFCALYYDSIDRETDAANRMGKALALRWVDDFLVVSTERADVEAFLHMLLEERSWGNNVKEEKVKTNFDYQSPNHTFTGESRLQWCGIDVELPNEQWQELAGVDSSPPSRGRKRQLPVRERPPKRGCCTGNVRLDLGLPATKYGSCPIRGLLCLQPTFRHRKRIATG